MAENHQFCEFCKILKQTSGNLLYKDENFFAFHDIDKCSARQHVLVCTTEHIETAMDIDDAWVLRRMRQVGMDVLDKLCEEQTATKGNYRFGFHLRPYNSIDHVHLHCFALPFSSFIKEKIAYGKLLTSIEEVIAKKDMDRPNAKL